MKYLALAALLVVGVAQAQVTSTRTTAYDWQCQDSAGVRISDHVRFDTAFVACLNAPNGVYVQGGRYRINRVVIAPQPPATTGSASLSWVAPTKNTDGSAITALSGYRIVYGTSATAMTQSLQVMNPALTSYIVSNLAPGTYFFAVIALAGSVESGPSNIATKSIS